VSPRGHQIALRFLADFEDLREHEKTEPAEVEALVSHIVAHLRSWRPESVSPLGTLPAPEEPNVDPRIPWPSQAEVAAENERNVAEAKAARTKRYPILRWADNIRYVDWYSRTHDELLAHALKMGLAGVGEAVEVGWVDRDEETGETTYTWIESPRSV
jgi:hypothetical protein